jgi:hypothetical protein
MASARKAALAPAPVPARPDPSQVVAGAPDAAHAWTALANAGLVPPGWVNEPRRRFHAYDETRCSACGGTDEALGYGETRCYAGCSHGFFYTDRWDSHPASTAECAMVAARMAALSRFEALAYDLFQRSAAWDRAAYDAGGRVVPLSPALVRWSLFPSSACEPLLPSVLQGAWHALRLAVPEAKLDVMPGIHAVRGWSEQVAQAWRVATSSGARVPAQADTQSYSIPPPLVGRAFAELPDPFGTSREIESFPFQLRAADAAAVDLWAFG